MARVRYWPNRGLVFECVTCFYCLHWKLYKPVGFDGFRWLQPVRRYAPCWLAIISYLVSASGITVNKQLLKEGFVISRIIKVEVSVISRSWTLRLITLTKTLISLGVTKPNLTIVILYIERKKWKSCFCFVTDGKRHKARDLDKITRDLECPWHDYFIIWSYDFTGADFENSLYPFGQSEKS